MTQSLWQLWEIDGDWSRRKLVSCSYSWGGGCKYSGLLRKPPVPRSPPPCLPAMDSSGWGDGVHVMPASASHFHVVSDLTSVIRGGPWRSVKGTPVSVFLPAGLPFSSCCLTETQPQLPEAVVTSKVCWGVSQTRKPL